MKFSNYLVIFLAVFFLLEPVEISAQSRKTKSAKPRKARLNLPDILLKRHQKRFQYRGVKIPAVKDSARMIPLHNEYQAYRLPQDSSSAGKPVEMKRTQSRQSFHKYRFGMGRFKNMQLEFVRWQKLASTEFRIQAQYERNDGQYENSALQKGYFAGQLFYWLHPRFRIISKINYAFKNYQLQASDKPEHARKWELMNVTGKTPFRGTKNVFGFMQFHFTHFKLTDEAKDWKSPGTNRENTISVIGKYFWRRGNWLLSADVSFLDNSFTSPADSTVNDFISRINSKALYEISSNLSVTCGINLYNISLENGYSASDFAPFGKITFSQKDLWGFYLSGSRDFEYLNFHSLWKVNPYLNSPSDIPLREIKYKTEIGFELNLLRDFQIHLRIQHRKAVNWGYFEKQTELYRYKILESLTQTLITPRIEWKISPSSELKAGAQIFHYQVQHNSLANIPANRIPYHEKVNFFCDAIYHLSKKSKFELKQKIIGPRYSSLYSSQTLKSYWLADLRFQKDFDEIVTLFLQVNNLLNLKYSVWNGYREMGINFVCGVQGKW